MSSTTCPTRRTSHHLCDLPVDAYCLVAVATRDCAVVGFGATPFDLSHHKHVTTAIQAVDAPQSQCTPPQQCVGGVCVSAEAGAPDVVPDALPDVAPDVAPDAPTGDWTSVGTSWLPQGGSAGSVANAPNVVATPEGFVVAYREYDPVAGSEDAVRVFIDNQGIRGEATRWAIVSCPGGPGAGLAAAWSDSAGAGFMAVAEPSCGAGESPRMHVSTFDEHGATIGTVEYDLPAEVAIAPLHGAAADPGASRFLLAGVSEGSAFLYRFDGVAVQVDMEAVATGSTLAQVATSAQVIATLASDVNAGGMKLVVAEPGASQQGGRAVPAG